MKNIIRFTTFSALIFAVAAVFLLSQQGTFAAVRNVESSIEVSIETAQPELIKETDSVKPTLRPVHISIPTARVNADVINVGVTETNNLDVPPNFVQTGWYEHGPLPGTPGNTVIDGHVDNGSSIDGVFKHLRKVKKGDVITIEMSDGTSVRYEVTGTEVVKTTEFPGESVFNGGDQAILKIITCHGKFVKALDTYDHRLIVTAELIN